MPETRPPAQSAAEQTSVQRMLDKAPTWFFKIMLLAAPLIWGASFVVMKFSLDAMGPSMLVGIRFAVAALLVLVFFFSTVRANLKRNTVISGVVLGVIFYIAYWDQNVGLMYTTPGKNAFLTAAYVVMVPFLTWIFSRKRPNAFNVVAAVLCLAGIGFVSLDGDLSLGFGDGMTILCALFFGLHITLLSKFAADYDVFTMTFLQFLMCGILGIAVSLLTEPLPVLDEVLNPSFIGQLAYLAIGASFVASMFQNIGQTRVNPSQAALFLSLEGVFGVLISVIFYGERPTLAMIFGFCLIFIAIIVSEVLAGRGLPWKKTTSS